MAILEIEENIHRYFVKVGNNKVDIHVVDDPDKTTSNKLDDLPDY